jgi:multimeric flavodoxin WrbA
MKILVIQGSPNMNGNTATLTAKLLEGLTASGRHDVCEFWLNEMNIRPCQACFQCYKTGRCAIEDDMHNLYPQFQPSNLVVFAVPIYWWHMNAQTKLCFDRLTALLSQGDKLPALSGKQVVLVTAYNYRHCAECTLSMFAEFREWIGVKLEVLEHCAREGHVSAHPEKLSEAYRLGLHLAGQAVTR